MESLIGKCELNKNPLTFVELCCRFDVKEFLHMVTVLSRYSGHVIHVLLTCSRFGVHYTSYGEVEQALRPVLNLIFYRFYH